MPPEFSASWQMTRNTYEAAALASLGIGVQPVTMHKHDSTSHDITEWNLQPRSADGLHITGQLRSAHNGGKLQGLFLAEPLHPYLIALRAMHNRSALLDAQTGRSYRSTETAPGSWILEKGTAPASDLAGAYIETTDQDRAIALLGVGCGLISITGPEGAKRYRLTRVELPSTLFPGRARADNGSWYALHSMQGVFPAHAESHFGRQLHALHALRELRKHQHTTRFIIVSHKTPRHRGAAFNDQAQGTVIDTVRRTLGTKL